MPAISPPPLIGTTMRSAFGAVGRDLQADRALSGDHRPVIERRDQHVPMPRHEFLSPKLRLTGSAILVLNWVLPAWPGWCSGYFKVSGMAAPMRSNACRCSLVGSTDASHEARIGLRIAWPPADVGPITCGAP